MVGCLKLAKNVIGSTDDTSSVLAAAHRLGDLLVDDLLCQFAAGEAEVASVDDIQVVHRLAVWAGEFARGQNPILDVIQEADWLGVTV